jgi:hypothetical protein
VPPIIVQLRLHAYATGICGLGEVRGTVDKRPQTNFVWTNRTAVTGAKREKKTTDADGSGIDGSRLS